MEKLSNVSRYVFWGGCLVTLGIGMSLLPYILQKSELTDEEKSTVKKRLYFMAGTASITVASAIVGTKAHGKISNKK